MQEEPELIWNDKGSGGTYDLSIFRARTHSTFYSLGDIPVGSYTAPQVSLIVKALQPGALKQPLNYRQRWNDRGSGADKDVAIFEPICYAGYVPLGHVAVESHSERPQTTDTVCVKQEYAAPGKWEWVWNDRSTGSDVDVTVWRAIPSDSTGQGVRAMGAVPTHGNMDRMAYVLKSAITDYVVGKPAARYILTNVKYLFNDRKMVSTTPEQLARTIIINRGDTVQKAVRTITYTYSETSDWSQAFGLEVGVSTTVTAGTPGLLSVSVS